MSKPTRFQNIMFGHDESTNPPVGGEIIRAICGNASLVCGSAVFWSAANTVNMSATVGDYAAFAGICVGGQSTGYEYVDDYQLYTSLPAAAILNEIVLIQITGIAFVLCGGTVTPFTHKSVIPDAAGAGRVVAGTTAGQMLATPISAGTVNTCARMLIRHR